MKRLLALLFVITMIVSGCGPAAVAPEPPAPAPESSEPQKTAPAFGLGLILSEDASESSLSEAHEVGVEAMKNALGIDESRVFVYNGVAPGDSEALRAAVESCAAENCGLVFAADSAYAQGLGAIAESYPEIYFACPSNGGSGSKNLSFYDGKLYQAFYLSGIAAGMNTTSLSVGFVASERTKRSVINAFAMGVSRANPDVRVLVTHTKSRFSPEEEGAAAGRLLDMGCDVLAQGCASNAPVLAASERGALCCGFGDSVPIEASDAVLTSPVWNLAVYFTRAAKTAMEGAELTDYYGGMEDGFVTLSRVTDNNADGTKSEVDAAKQEILSGTDVFTHEIVTNNGELISPEGEQLTRADIDSMNWYYRNIELW